MSLLDSHPLFAGSGKSTMLNCLSGRNMGPNLSGNIIVNGRPLCLLCIDLRLPPGEVLRDLNAFRRVTAFVSQDDYFFESLTVRETLMYAARLKIGGDVSYADKEKRVNEVRWLTACSPELMLALAGSQ